MTYKFDPAKLKSFMERKGITAYYLSKVTGMGESRISQILSSKAKPSVTFFEKILTAYPDIVLNDLFTMKE